MNHQELVAKYRDGLLGQGGSVRAAPGDKLFIKVFLNPIQTPGDPTCFKVWVKGRVAKAFYDSVQLEEIVLVNRFENEETQRICEENFNDIKKRFRGSKTIVLKKDDSWILVPKDMKTGLSSLMQEQISDALGLTDSTTEVSQETPQLERMNTDILLQTINTKIVLGKEQKKNGTKSS